MRILVTGATGFVGRTLIHQLKRNRPEDELYAFILPGEEVPDFFREYNVGILIGDITNRTSVDAAVKGKDIVLHLAGYISYWRKDIPKLEAVNVAGVGHVVDSCVRYGVKRLVHVSSVGAIGFYTDGTPADEETAWNWSDRFPYMTTKKKGEDLVLDAVREQDLDAVILNPASIMGPGDPSPETAHNRLYGNIYTSPFFLGSFAGGLALVDVRDLCGAIISAIENGEAGERFLIIGANVRYSEVLRLIGIYAKKAVFPFSIPPFLLVAAGLFMEFLSSITRKRPLLTSAYGRLSGWFAYYSNEKSKKILGVKYRSIETTIEDGCHYYESAFMK